MRLTTSPAYGILRAMNEELRARADRNLRNAAEALNLADPRPAYRERLRMLKEDRPEAFARALRHYEEVVMPVISSEGDVIEAWIQYGSTIAAFTAPGRLLYVDETGYASRYAPPVRQGSLVLHVPDDNSAAVLVAVAPSVPTPAQQATLDLLVNQSLGLSTD